MRADQRRRVAEAAEREQSAHAELQRREAAARTAAETEHGTRRSIGERARDLLGHSSPEDRVAADAARTAKEHLRQARADLAESQAVYEAAVAEHDSVLATVARESVALSDTAGIALMKRFEAGSLTDRDAVFDAVAKERVRASLEAARAIGAQREIMSKREGGNPMETAAPETLITRMTRGSTEERVAAMTEWIRRGDDRHRVARETQVAAFLAMKHGPVDMQTGEGKTLVTVMKLVTDATDHGTAHAWTSSDLLAGELAGELQHFIERPGVDLGIDVYRMDQDNVLPEPSGDRRRIIVGTKEDYQFRALKAADSMIGKIEATAAAPGDATALREWLNTKPSIDDIKARLDTTAREGGLDDRFDPFPAGKHTIDELDSIFDGNTECVLSPGAAENAPPADVARLEQIWDRLTTAEREYALTASDFGKPDNTRGMWSSKTTPAALEKLNRVAGDPVAPAEMKLFADAANARWGVEKGTHYIKITESDGEGKIGILGSETNDKPMWDREKSTEVRWQDIGQFVDLKEGVPVRADQEHSLRMSDQQLIGSKLLFEPSGLSGTLKGVENALYDTYGVGPVPEIPRFYDSKLTVAPPEFAENTQAKLERMARDIVADAKVVDENQTGNPQWVVCMDNGEIRGDPETGRSGLIDWITRVTKEEYGDGFELKFEVVDADFYAEHGGSNAQAEALVRQKIKEFGEPGSIYITNKDGGRGADPTPSKESVALGGVNVKVSGGPAYSPRVNEQVDGRAGRSGFGDDRQHGGTPGSAVHYISPEDFRGRVVDHGVVQQVVRYQTAVEEFHSATTNHQAEGTATTRAELDQAETRLNDAEALLRDQAIPAMKDAVERDLLESRNPSTYRAHAPPADPHSPETQQPVHPPPRATGTTTHTPQIPIGAALTDTAKTPAGQPVASGNLDEPASGGTAAPARAAADANAEVTDALERQFGPTDLAHAFDMLGWDREKKVPTEPVLRLAESISAAGFRAAELGGRQLPEGRDTDDWLREKAQNALHEATLGLPVTDRALIEEALDTLRRTQHLTAPQTAAVEILTQRLHTAHQGDTPVNPLTDGHPPLDRHSPIDGTSHEISTAPVKPATGQGAASALTVDTAATDPRILSSAEDPLNQGRGTDHAATDEDSAVRAPGAEGLVGQVGGSDSDRSRGHGSDAVAFVESGVLAGRVAREYRWGELFDDVVGRLNDERARLGLDRVEVRDPFEPRQVETLTVGLSLLLAGMPRPLEAGLAGAVERLLELTEQVRGDGVEGARQLRDTLESWDARAGRDTDGNVIGERDKRTGVLVRDGVVCGPALAMMLNDLFHSVRSADPVLAQRVRAVGVPRVTAEKPESEPASLSFLFGGHARYVGQGVAGHRSIEARLFGALEGRPVTWEQRLANHGRAVVVFDAYTGVGDHGHAYLVVNHHGELLELDPVHESYPVVFDPQRAAGVVSHSRVIEFDARGVAVDPIVTDLSEPLGEPPGQAPPRMPPLLGKPEPGNEHEPESSATNTSGEDPGKPSSTEEAETKEPAKSDSLAQRVRDDHGLLARLFGESVNLTGFWVTDTMTQLYFLQQVGPGTAGAIGWVLKLPYIGGVLASGPVADHAHPKKWLVISQLTSAAGGLVGFIVLAADSPYSVPVLVGTTLLRAGASALYETAIYATLNRMIGKGDAQAGLTRFTMLNRQLTRVAGQGLAPILLTAGAWTGPATGVTANLVNLATLSGLPSFKPAAERNDGENAWVFMRKSLAGGWHAVQEQPILRRNNINAALLDFYLGLQSIQFPLLMSNAGLSVWDQGAVMAIAPMGAVVGSAVRKKWLATTSIDALLAAKLAGVAGPAILQATTGNPWVAAAGFAATWATFGTVQVPLQTYINNTTPNEVLGRSKSISGVTAVSALSLGPVVAGGGIALLGAEATGASVALASSASAGWYFYRWLFKGHKLLDCINQTYQAVWALGLDTGVKPRKWQKSPEHLRRAIATQLVKIDADPDTEDPVTKTIDAVRNLEDGADTAVLDVGEKMHAITITTTDNKPGGHIVVFDTNITNPGDPHTDPGDPERIPRVRILEKWDRPQPVQNAFVAFLTTDEQDNLTNLYPHDPSQEAPRRNGKVLGPTEDQGSSEPGPVPVPSAEPSPADDGVFAQFLVKVRSALGGSRVESPSAQKPPRPTPWSRTDRMAHEAVVVGRGAIDLALGREMPSSSPEDRPEKVEISVSEKAFTYLGRQSGWSARPAADGSSALLVRGALIVSTEPGEGLSHSELAHHTRVTPDGVRFVSLPYEFARMHRNGSARDMAELNRIRHRLLDQSRGPLPDHVIAREIELIRSTLPDTLFENLSPAEHAEVKRAIRLAANGLHTTYTLYGGHPDLLRDGEIVENQIIGDLEHADHGTLATYHNGAGVLGDLRLLQKHLDNLTAQGVPITLQDRLDVMVAEVYSDAVYGNGRRSDNPKGFDELRSAALLEAHALASGYAPWRAKRLRKIVLGTTFRKYRHTGR
ncbi:hypothetical protein [Nocardia sp. NPDC002869]|uniref:hypothetical protein n=1 Tax=Nocardia sp. NPDC002869 TaxID=3161032 RepID=UPI00398D4461